jgi:hypothetical protein
MISIQKFPKITGKCSILLYFKASSAKIPPNVLKKAALSKIFNLSLIKDFLLEDIAEKDFSSENVNKLLLLNST